MLKNSRVFGWQGIAALGMSVGAVPAPGFALVEQYASPKRRFSSFTLQLTGLEAIDVGHHPGGVPKIPLYKFTLGLNLDSRFDMPRPVAGRGCA